MLKIDKSKTVCGIKIWDMPAEPVQQARSVCRSIAADGAVLLKNEGVLPFAKGEKVAVFGRLQNTYYRSGTGSGRVGNIEIEPNIIESLRADGNIIVDNELAKIYEDWIAENPFDEGHGWATEPYSQVEMPLEEAVVSAAADRNNSAVVIIGRSAGEDNDSKAEPGCYFLTKTEETMLRLVSLYFKRFAVVLNVGNIIDLGFEEKYHVPALMYVWQGGMEGANALADMLCGRVSPSGKLPDTQAFNYKDYPSSKNFGDPNRVYYEEDIYVGYRYFETFAPKKVQYPFGFGLTYTTFATDYKVEEANGEITVTSAVKNTGNFAAREVVQVYYGAPCGKLGTPAKQLAGFAKTKMLQPGESTTVLVKITLNSMASYDDSGVTGQLNAYVLEPGDYIIYAGTDVRTAQPVFTHKQTEQCVVLKLQEVLAPLEKFPFKRFHAVLNEKGERLLCEENVPTAKTNMEQRANADRPEEIPYTGDRGIRLVDVANQKANLKDFIAQMSDTDLCTIVLGEGMCSPKAAPATGAAFGGVTDSLLNLGIPVAGASDGPAGLRLMDNLPATAMPIGTLLAATWDEAAVEQLHAYIGIECFTHHTDALLGPGINIHRSPLNGRNFEYYTEDPLLCGKIAAAATRGVAQTGCSTVIKHFFCNSQEFRRHHVETIVSQRALREIYLKGFEIAVKEGGATAIMTSYNPVNGYWSSSNYDLTTTVLRNEWGFDGFVMTDWWALNNCAGEGGKRGNLKAMIRAQNDIFMVCPDASSEQNNLFEGLQEGYITRGHLQRSAANLLQYIMKSPSFMRYVDGGCVKPVFETADESKMMLALEQENILSGTEFTVTFHENKKALFKLELSTEGNPLAQSTVCLKAEGQLGVTFAVNGSDGKHFEVQRMVSAAAATAQKVTVTFDKAVTVHKVKVLV